MPYTSRLELRNAHRGYAAKRASISSRYTRSWRRRAVRNGSVLDVRQHAIDDQRADAHAGFVELRQRAGGFLDRQPLGDQHQHEAGRAAADQAGAQLAQAIEPARRATS